MKRRCPKCQSFQFHSGERFDCKECGYSTDDCIVTKQNRATHRPPPTIMKALPHHKVNGSKGAQ